MREEPNAKLDAYRRRHPVLGDSPDGANHGYFVAGGIRIISSGTPSLGESGYGWEHVSVSLQNRCPTWDEMAFVKRLFWGDDETVIQFHPPKSQYVNCHPFTLHLWRNTLDEIALPPTRLIGPLSKC